MSQLIGQKFLPLEWRLANQARYGSAELQRARSEHVTAESRRLMEESERAAARTQQDANKRLEQRIHDLQFWRRELDHALQETVQEIDQLVTFRSRLEKALESCDEPLRVTLLCLAERQKRVDIDLVHDEVERELMKEREVIEGVATLLQRTLEQTNEQIRLCRSAKYALEKDLRDKFQAERIDDFCSILTSTSPQLDGVSTDTDTAAPGATVTPQEWESFSHANISRAERQRSASLSLRALVDSLLEQTAGDMTRQNQATGHALARQVHQTKTAKGGLEDQLSKLLSEVSSQERNLEALREAVSEKMAPLKVAQARLSARALRPALELCHDPAQLRLLAQAQELSRSISRLREAQAQAEVELRALVRGQLALEEEVQVKSHSLYIDEVICTQLRQPVVIHGF